MSYSLIKIPKENYLRLIDTATPLYLPLGALSAADACVLALSVVVGAFAGTTATMTLQESYDAGVTFTDVITIADTINATGQFTIKLSPANGPVSPVTRLVIQPAAATSLYVTEVYRTFIQSSVMSPRDVAVNTSAIASEATQLLVLGAVDGLETLVTSTNSKIDDTNTKLDTANASLTTIDGHIDGLETLVTATNTKIDDTNTKLDTANSTLTTIDGHVDGLETLVTSTNTKLDTALECLKATFFTKPFDQIVPSSTTYTKVYTTKLAGVTQQVLTITYSDAAQQDDIDYKVV